jgi:glucose/arabinose dehydrogenase
MPKARLGIRSRVLAVLFGITLVGFHSSVGHGVSAATGESGSGNSGNSGGDVVHVADSLQVKVLQRRIGSTAFAPRAAVETKHGLFVLDFGGWVKGRGTLFLASPTAGSKRSVVFRGLDRPNGMMVGPDGWVYVGEVSKIFRFDPAQPKSTKQTVTTIPAKSTTWKHPLTQFAFTNESTLLVNFGSRTDNCAKERRVVCKEASTAARVLQAPFANGVTAGPLTSFATGLRNSMGLAVHSSGTIVQAENSRDFIDQADPKLNDVELPHDEINVLVTGGNYGWPYCFDAQRNAPEFPTYACKTKSTSPAILLPAHSAPLGMTYWKRPGKPEVLVVGYHGYRNTGHRLVSFAVDAKGVPSGQPTELVRWAGEDDAADEIPGPVGVSVAADGGLLVADDRRGMVLKIQTT